MKLGMIIFPSYATQNATRKKKVLKNSVY